ncbi:CocE/NonD family hydrolase [Nakamurella leprariae]|uniref:CocE/NonD family hydrolase n=1 Tax=Nakamurella leprariae TaxID=2803911 RepID=A0A938YGC4_9ACTN|nr:CocE/NonD family hydrolase [Nakamurella leprariae]MBM9469011.1 CocE/NonD family hydrolase [Nakamurella leprariae]
MPVVADAPHPDRPWRRPGRFGYALTRIRGALRPPVTVTEPDPGSLVVHRDVPVPTRDGTVLRANVFLPAGPGPFPVILCAHPYGKDTWPTRTRRGRMKVDFQYRILRQAGPVAFSALTTWESPDPARWTARGYALVNADLRGAGTSEGTGSLLSDLEARDVADLIDWAGTRDWSTGSVGMLGVSYLAISQWKAAGLHPEHLRAIVPWEGLTDAYRDLGHPGGVRERGFIVLWGRVLRRVRLADRLDEETKRRPLLDEYWRSKVPDLAAIEVPALICGSFSDNNLHSRGSIRAFEQISSTERHLWTHRTGKWSAFYSSEAQAAQLRFLDRHLKDQSGAPLPPVRLEIRDRGNRVVEIRDEQEWPLARTAWTPLHVTTTGLTSTPAAQSGAVDFDSRTGGFGVGWTVPQDTELTGPMAARLFVSLQDPAGAPGVGSLDARLFVGVEQWRRGRFVGYEGSYGFGHDRVTTGWQRVSLRRLDEAASRPFEPMPTFDRPEPVRAGQIVPVDVALGPSATLFRAGDQLRLVVAGRWLSPRNPLTGGLPANYETGPRVAVTLHWGPEHPSQLLVPVIPRSS